MNPTQKQPLFTCFSIVYHSLLHFLSLQPIIYQPPRYTSFLRNLWHRIASKETTTHQFFLLQPQFSTGIVGCETYHYATGIRPRLTTEIAYVRNVKSRFLHHFTLDTLFQGFPRLHESCHQSIEIASEILCTHHQDLVVTLYTHDNGRCQIRIKLLPTLRAFLSYCRYLFQWYATSRTITIIPIPIQYLKSFSCHIVFL